MQAIAAVLYIDFQTGISKSSIVNINLTLYTVSEKKIIVPPGSYGFLCENKKNIYNIPGDLFLCANFAKKKYLLKLRYGDGLKS